MVFILVHVFIPHKEHLRGVCVCVCACFQLSINGKSHDGILFSLCSVALILCVEFGLHVCLCTMCMQCPRRPEEATGSPRTGIADGSKLPCGPWDSNLGPPQKQAVL